MSDLYIPAITADMDTLTAALAYADAGWYVLPVRLDHPDRSKRKSPGSVVGNGWPAMSSSDPKTITAWFAATSHGIALHAGRSGAVILDVDDYEHVPDEVLAATETTGCPYQSTRQDQPGRGHYLFANSTGRRIGNSLGALATTPKWGEVRGANGVIIVAPSVHPEGGCYRWERTGPVPPIPDYLAEALPDSTTPESTATEAEIRKFVAAHADSTKPEALTGLVNTLTSKLDDGHSCHMSTLGAVTDAMAEAAAGYYAAETAITRLYEPYEATVTTGTSTGRVLTPQEAGQEYAGMVAWAIGQAESGIDKAHERMAEKYPDGVEEVSAADLAPDTEDGEDEPTTWEPLDLGPWLSGDRITPQPSIGISRSDGTKVLYAGREHSIFGETESGKTWFAAQCAAVEIRLGHDVLYIHYEEGDPGSTIERLLLLGVSGAEITQHLRFVAPSRPARFDWLAGLLDPPPALVIHDGINEAMSLHADKIMDPDGAAGFRRRLVKPCLRVGAATLACDHVTKSSDSPRGRYAIGSGHKVNAIDGAAFLIENFDPFGRGLRGASSVYVTKDRPGQLRAHGKPTGIPGKTYFGTLVLDATGDTPDPLTFYAPRDDEEDQAAETDLHSAITDIIAALPGGQVSSMRALLSEMRVAGHQFRDTAVRNVVDDLVTARRLVPFAGRKNSTGYRVPSASQPPTETSASGSASASASPIGGEAGSADTSCASDELGSSGKNRTSKRRQRDGSGGTSSPEKAS